MPATPWIHGDDLTGITGLTQDHIVGPNKTAAHKVDEMASEQILRKQNLAFASLKTTKVDPTTIESNGPLDE